MIYKGDKKINAIHAGSREVNSVYRGKDLVFSKSDGGLPAEYQAVEYIESTGTQYIDTGIAPSPNFRFDMKAAFTTTNGAQVAAGAYQKVSTGYHVFCAIFRSRDGLFQFATMTDSPQLTYTIGASDTNIHEVSYDIYGSKYLFDGTEYELVYPYVFTMSKAITLFVYNSEVLEAYAKARMYSVQIYDADTLVRDFVPCYRKFDGAVGMYDLCGSASSFDGTPFYGNLGNGDFIKGKNV